MITILQLYNQFSRLRQSKSSIARKKAVIILKSDFDQIYMNFKFIDVNVAIKSTHFSQNAFR